ncbi:J domain-containing protein [Tumidithrix elongata RA019]|uniref:J domain-containing protein n=1 Tax=Tumidithrix elongata BACA0141 TaxID=2716417 RepID=A0AAW9PVQ3_9CYAN|nr:J domain-containing protein [Tumidithrix elongata RA019]
MQSAPKQAKTYYAILGLTPWASAVQIRQAYRDLSKLYHPDTTQLSKEIAIEQFRQINEAYATLSNPERRNTYDQMIRFSKLNYVNQTNVWDTANTGNLGQKNHHPLQEDDGLPSERPLSGGELFVLFLIAVTFIVCVLLVLLVGWLRGDALLPEILSTTLHFLPFA